MSPLFERSRVAGLNGTWWLLACAIALYLLLSAPALAALGVPYDVPMGSFPAKIHPGTYVLGLACAVAWHQSAQGLGGLWQSCREQPLLVASLLCMVSCFAWAVLRHGPSGLAFFIDTLFTPAVAGLLIARQPQAARLALLQLVMWILLCNAALAVVESVLRLHVVPGVMGAGEGEGDAFFRASALLGHPLTNAKVTVTALPFVMSLPWSTRSRAAAAVLLSLALLCFGGRTSLAMGALVYGVCGTAWLLGRVVQGRFTYLQLTGGSVAVALGLASVSMAVVGLGLGDRIFHNFTWDNSADVRFLAWRTLDHFNDLDLWLGLPISGIDHLAERVGIDMRFEAIENFWVYQLLLLGITGFVPFVLGLGLLVVHLLRRSTPVLCLASLVYWVVASGTNSLASKTISLLMLSVLVHASVRDEAVGASKRGTP